MNLKMLTTPLNHRIKFLLIFLSFILFNCGNIKVSDDKVDTDEVSITLQNSNEEKIDHLYLLCENHIYINRDISKYDVLVNEKKVNRNELISVIDSKNKIIVKPNKQITNISLFEKDGGSKVASFDLKVLLIPKPTWLIKNDKDETLISTKQNYISALSNLTLEIIQEEDFLTLVPDDSKYRPEPFVWQHENNDTIETEINQDGRFIIKNPINSDVDSAYVTLIFRGLIRNNKSRIVGEYENFKVCIVK